jgi:hypothetical protein
MITERDFCGGHPSKHYSHLTLLNFTDHNNHYKLEYFYITFYESLKKAFGVEIYLIYEKKFLLKITHHSL